MSIDFEHPFDTPSTSVTLRNPELGDSDILQLKVRFHTAMDGTDYSYKYTEPVRRLLLTFNMLTITQVNALKAFIAASEGDEVKYTDFLTNIWRGHILTVPYEITEQSRRVCDSYNITIEFEGYNTNMLFLLTEDLENLLTEDSIPLLLEGFE